MNNTNFARELCYTAVLIDKILHKLKSRPKRGFGIHSPFVFCFQREVLHPKKKNARLLYKTYENEQDKILRLLLRIYTYYKVQEVFLGTEFAEKGFEKYGIAYDNELELSKKYKLAVIGTSSKLDENCLCNQAFVVLTGNRAQILENPLREQCDVFLDLYEIGICVFDKGLSKQEFKLKL